MVNMGLEAVSPDMPLLPFHFREEKKKKNSYIFSGVKGNSKALHLVPFDMGSWALLCSSDVTCTLMVYEICYVGHRCWWHLRMRTVYIAPLQLQEVSV